jgi:filamentous hemagglutinin family protein
MNKKRTHIEGTVDVNGAEQDIWICFPRGATIEKEHQFFPPEYNVKGVMEPLAEFALSSRQTEMKVYIS